MHAAAAAGDLVGQRLGGDGQRAGVGHLEDGGDAAHHGRARAGLEVFLVLGAGLAEMDLRVDHAGQDGEAACNRRPRRPGCRVDGADRGDPAVADADVAHTDAVVVDDGRAFEDGIECVGQGAPHRAAETLPRAAVSPAYVSRAAADASPHGSRHDDAAAARIARTSRAARRRRRRRRGRAEIPQRSGHRRHQRGRRAAAPSTPGC